MADNRRHCGPSRNVPIGNALQLRIAKGGDFKPPFNWTTTGVKLVGRQGSSAVIAINGVQYVVAKGCSVSFRWREEHRIVITVGRTHGQRIALTVVAPHNVGIQWDDFKGSIRPGLTR